MKSDYKKWFDLQLSHNYFESLVYSDFELIPFEETARAFKNYEIKMIKGEQQVSFYVTPKSNSISEHIEGLQNIRFQVVNKDLLFFNCTDVPHLDEDQVFCFENRSGANLQSSAFAGEDDLVSTWKKKSSILLPKDNVSIEIKTKDGLSVLRTSNQGVERFPLDLGALEDGRYQLWLNGQKNEDFFLCDEAIHPSTLGVLSINLTELQAITETPAQLKVSFEARSAFISYQVVVPSARKIEVKEMSISSNNGVIYEGPIKKSIVGHQTASVFTSKSAVQLHQKAQSNPQLRVTYANQFALRNKLLEKNLPQPEIEHLQKINSSSGQDNYLLSTIIYV